MANTKQAAKRARKSQRQRATNVSQRTTLRGAIKRVRKAVEAGAHDVALAAYKTEQSTIDALARKGIIHKNKAARHKSRLAARIKALGAPRT
jgi:small subunit ribosomal protein S20